MLSALFGALLHNINNKIISRIHQLHYAMRLQSLCTLYPLLII